MGRAVLLLVSGFVIIFGMVQNSVQNRQQVLAERSPEYYYEEQSRNIAYSMMEVALSKLNDNMFNPAAAKDDGMEIMDGTGVIDFYKPPENFNSRVFLEIKGIAGSDDSQTTTTIRAIANRPAFSIYSYFTDEEPVIYFADGDVINGPVHTNGTFHIDGDPVFNGRVTSPNEPEEQPGSDPEYNGGKNFNSEEIELPEDMAKISDEAAAGGLQFDDDKIKVEFNEDGTADITTYQETNSYQGDCIDYTWWGNCTAYETIYEYSELSTQNYNLTHSGTFNGIISSSGKVEVKGTLEGNVTLHSSQDIEILGDIMYKDYDPANPSEELASDNLLGIVSEGNVTIDEDAHSDQGSSDLHITASIMAMGESFEVEDYDDGDHRGQLRVLGGLIQKKRGPVGTSGGTGYDKFYSYDTRLLDNSTPDFPKVKRFQIENWRESTIKN
ncbi:MAG: DUF4900 domain-containing protein [Balneolaceae bacterium]|nr:DUF4900 domain-containing protein [Balneolaceae bacterium]